MSATIRLEFRPPVIRLSLLVPVQVQVTGEAAERRRAARGGS